MQTSPELSRLVAHLDLAPGDVDRYIGQPAGGPWPRLFGGHVIAQALAAASRSVAQIPAHSLHVYFLRPGDSRLPIEYRVERVRDGRSFSTRTVTALQQNEVILTLAASFHVPEADGFEHQVTAIEAPAPETCPRWEDWMAPWLARFSEAERAEFLRNRFIEIRPLDPVEILDPQPAGMQQRLWIRAGGALPDDAQVHQSVAAYASDHMLIGCMMRPHGRSVRSRDIMAASLDHALWFHRPFRMDQWLLYVQESPVSFGSRGLALGHYFTRDGVLVASVAQEGLLRRVKPA